MDDLWSISNEIQVSKNRHVCGIDGCTKSYSSRQNCYRHRTKDHPTRQTKSSTPKRAREPIKPLEVEKNELLLAFSTLYDHCSKDVAINFVRNHKPVANHLTTFMKLLDEESLNDQEVLNGTSINMVDPLTSLQGLAGDAEQSTVMKACADIARRGTPESLALLRRMGNMMISIAKQADDTHSGSSNHIELLREVLDSLYAKDSMSQDNSTSSPLHKRSLASSSSPIPTDVSSTISQSDIDCATSSTEQPPNARAVAVPSPVYAGHQQGSSKRMRTNPAAIGLATASLDLDRHFHINIPVDSRLFEWEL